MLPTSQLHTSLIVLRLLGLYVFFYSQFVQKDYFMVCHSMTSTYCRHSTLKCWESYVGHQVYSVFVVTFIFELVTSIGINPIKAVLNKYTECYGKVHSA